MAQSLDGRASLDLCYGSAQQEARALLNMPIKCIRKNVWKEKQSFALLSRRKGNAEAGCVTDW
jgi:hypothetical protein